MESPHNTQKQMSEWMMHVYSVVHPKRFTTMGVGEVSLQPPPKKCV